jgi:ABC-type molybdate transport system permease subunit
VKKFRLWMLYLAPVIVGFSLMFLLSTLGWAGDYTVTLTTEQEVSLAWRLKIINTKRAAQEPPLEALTSSDLIRAIFSEVLSGIQKNLEAEAAKLGQEGWATLAPEDQATICTAYDKAGTPLPVCP